LFNIKCASIVEMSSACRCPCRRMCMWCMCMVLHTTRPALASPEHCCTCGSRDRKLCAPRVALLRNATIKPQLWALVTAVLDAACPLSRTAACTEGSSGGGGCPREIARTTPEPMLNRCRGRQGRWRPELRDSQLGPIRRPCPRPKRDGRQHRRLLVMAASAAATPAGCG